jgi:hypothetical protein
VLSMRAFSASRLAPLTLLAALAGLALLGSRPRDARAAAFPTNNTIMLAVAGRDQQLSNGEYVTEDDGLNSTYRYFIEVPSGYSGTLTIDLFDADTGAGGSSDPWDYAHGGSFDTTLTYSLTSPSGGTLTPTFTTSSASAPSSSNNVWRTFYTTASATPGHYQFTIASTAEGDDDINRFSIRAHDGNTGSGGTEFPIYAESFFAMFVDQDESGSSPVYPWITSDCRVRGFDWDNDSRGQLTFVSRTGAINQAFGGSAGSSWGNNLTSAHAGDAAAADYGIWRLTIAQQDENFTTYYVGNSAAANPPTSQPQANTFRIYLPTDGGAAPVKPYVAQQVGYESGPNPPVNGQTTRVRVIVNVVNPTTRPIVFSNTNLVTAFIPAARNAYRGVTVQQGSMVSAPALGSTGTLTWNPGTVAAGTSAAMTYLVDVTPTAGGQRTPVIGSFSSNGTTARYVDETGNTTQARATYTFGPLCELAVTSGTSVATEVRMAAARAEEYAGGARISWETGHEVDNLGFNVYRAEGGHRVRLNSTPIAGSALRVGAGVPVSAGLAYSWWDAHPGPEYWLEDLDLDGRRTWHGPIRTTRRSGAGPAAPASPLLGAQADAPSASSCACTEPLPRAAPAAGPAPPAWRAVAAGPALKITVEREGWYQLSQADLLAAGLSPRTDPRKLNLYVDGQPVPVLIPGEKDGRLDPADSLQFYGLGVDTPLTAARVYWLVLDNKRPVRLGRAPGGRGPLAGGAFPYTVERKERVNYFPALLNGEADNFFGPLIFSEPLERPLEITGLQAGGAGVLELFLQGVVSLDDVLPDHQVLVRLNGTTLGVALFDGRANVRREFPIPAGVLVEGENTLTLLAEGGPADFSLLDSVRVTYPRRYLAEGDFLRFSAPAGRGFRVGGFSNLAVRVIDITDAAQPLELPVSVLPGEPHEGSTYAVSGQAPPGDGTRWFLAFAAGREAEPARVALNQPSQWLRRGPGADLVILTPPEFLAAAQPLAQLRTQQGLGVAVVRLDDVYDELSYGQPSLTAVRDFLAQTQTLWRRAPRFVLLLGDASFDPRDYLGFGSDQSRIPAPLVPTAFLETAGDDWYVDFDGDDRPELALGRLPAASLAEAHRLVGKTVAYEQALGPAGAAGARGRRIGPRGGSGEVLLVADSGFESVLAARAKQVPAGLTPRTLTRGVDDKSALLGAWNQGPFLVQYHGHGSGNLWNGDYLTAGDAEGLTNGTALPIVSPMTCFNGYFVELYYETLAEALLRAPAGGAVAVWASAGFCDAEPQETLSAGLFSALGKGPATLGEACAAAKRQVDDTDVRRSWNLLGDPCLRLR